MPSGSRISVERVVDRAQEAIEHRAKKVREELRRAQLAAKNRKRMLDRAARIADGCFTPHKPPKGWGFVPHLLKRAEGKKPQKDREGRNVSDWSDDAANDWKTFREWLSAMTADIDDLVEVLVYFSVDGDEPDGEPRARLDPKLHVGVWAEGTKLKEAYRAMKERGEIEWIPRHYFSHRLRDPRRRQISPIEFLQAALMDFDDARGPLC